MVNKEAQEHLTAHPDVSTLLLAAISKLTIGDSVSHIEKEINFGRVVGISNLIPIPKVGIDQKTYFAFRKARKCPSHVVLNQKDESCDTITVEVNFDESSQKWILSTAYIGHICPNEPFYFENKTTPEFKEALAFWSEHALIYDETTMNEPFKSTWQDELKKVVV